MVTPFGPWTNKPCRGFYFDKVCNVNAVFFISIIQIQQYIFIIKLHVNGLEAMHIDINSVTTDQPRIKCHLSAQVVKKCIKRLVLVISIPISIKQSISKKDV